MEIPSNINSKTLRVVKLILAAFAFILYINSVGNDYNLDDELVTNNHKLTSKGISAIPEIFSSPYYSDDQGYRYEYRPVVLTSFAIEHQFFGDSPKASHFFNVVFYILTILVLFSCLRLLFQTESFFLPVVITLLFIAHPTHTEVVASIKNRDEILSLMGGFLSLMYALKYAHRNKLILAIVSILFFVLGILSKKSILPFSVLIPIAMILFTSASFFRILIISVSLSLITTLFSPLFYLSNQVLLFIGLIAVPAVLYWIVRAESISIKTLKELVAGFFTEKETEAPEQEVETIGGNQTPLPLLSTLLLSLGTLILVGAGLGFSYLSLTFLGFGFAIFLIYRSGKNQLQWPVFLFAMLIAATAYVYKNSLLLQASIIFYLYLILTKKIRINVILAGLIFAAFAAAILSIDLRYWHALALYTLAMFLYSRQNPKLVKFGLAWVVAITIFHDPSLVFNTIAHIFMLALIGYDYFILKGKPLQRAWFLYLPVLLLISSIFFSDLQKDWTARNQEVVSAQTPDIFPASGRELEYAEMPLTSETSVSERVGTSFYVLAKYLKLVVVPYPLGFYYGFSEIPVVEWTHWLSLLSIFIHVLLGLLALVLIRKIPILSYGIIFYLASISVFSNLAAPVAGLMADRYLLSASLGFCIILTWGLFRLFKLNPNDTKLQLRNIPKNLFIAAGAILLLYSVETIARNFKWKDHLTLFQNDIENLENSAQAHNLLAIHLTKRGFKETDQVSRNKYFSPARDHFMRALEIDESFFNARFDLGRVAAAMGEYPQAIAAFKQVFEMDTTFYTPLVEVALIYEQQNIPERAIPVYRKIIEVDSTYVPAYTNLSMIYFQRKEYDKAIDINKEAIKAVPTNYDPYVNIGKTFFNMAKKDSALVYFEKASQLDNSDPMLMQIISDIKRELGKQ